MARYPGVLHQESGTRGPAVGLGGFGGGGGRGGGRPELLWGEAALGQNVDPERKCPCGILPFGAGGHRGLANPETPADDGGAAIPSADAPIRNRGGP